MSTNKLFFISAFALLCTTGCASDWFVTHNGNMPTNERISQVNVGQSKQQVQQVLGTPSSVVSLDQNTWIYMSSDIKRVAFFEPEEISRDVLTIKFNKDDKVADIKRLKKENGREITVSSDETPKNISAASGNTCPLDRPGTTTSDNRLCKNEKALRIAAEGFLSVSKNGINLSYEIGYAAISRI